MKSIIGVKRASLVRVAVLCCALRTVAVPAL
jgi:hypothetical protein